jgi:hypothetical protein
MEMSQQPYSIEVDQAAKTIHMAVEATEKLMVF